MRKRIANLIIVVITIFVLVELLIKKEIIYSAIMNALDIWVKNLIPSLFPFFIIADILINYNITAYIPKIIKKFCKDIFNISDNMLVILFLSMISGFPSNARNTRIMYDKGLIDIEEANHILIFSHFANPIFILTTVAVFFLNDEKLGIILLICHYLSNFILGVIVRNRFKHDDKSSNKIIINNFGNIFINSIEKAIDTILMICGIIIVFSILSSIIVTTFNVSSYNEMIVKGLLEITIGIKALSTLNINMCYKVVITSCMLSFGGFSVHVQVLSQIVGTRIKYQYFLIGRIYQMIISGFMAYIICLILKI